MNDNEFDHVGLVDTKRHCTSIPYEKITTHRLCGKIMRQQIDTTAAYNYHDSLSGPYQHGGTSSLTTVNLIGRISELVRYNPGLLR